MALQPVSGVVQAREGSAPALAPEVEQLVRSIGFPEELGPPEQWFVQRDITHRGPGMAAHIRANGFEPDSEIGKAVADAARAMNGDRGPQTVFNLALLDGQPIQVRARAWSALRRMTDALSPQPEPVAARAPEGAAPGVPGSPRPVLAEPKTSRKAPSRLPDHSQLRGVSVEFREWFGRPENQKQVFAMLLERQPESLRQGLDQIEARYPSASTNLQHVLANLQTGLVPFGYQGDQQGIPNERMGTALAFAREQVRPHFAGISTRTAAILKARELNLQGSPDLLAAVQGATLGWRPYDTAAMMLAERERLAQGK